MREKGKKFASAVLGIGSAVCMVCGAALQPGAKMANAETIAKKSDFFYVEGVDKASYVYTNEADKGVRFTEGSNITFEPTENDSSRFTGSKKYKPVIERKSQTRNTINGSFKGDFSINYELIDYLKCYNSAMWEEVGSLSTDYANNFWTYYLTTQSIMKQGAMTFRFVPVSDSKAYIDVCLTFTAEPYMGIVGSYIVVYNDESGNKFVRTIARSGQTIPDTNIEVWSSSWGQQRYWTETGTNRFTSTAMNNTTVGTPRADGMGRTCVDYNNDTGTYTSSQLSSSTLSLVWEGDVLKIQGKAGTDGTTYTYAAFDGTASDSFTSSREDSYQDIINRAKAAYNNEDGADEKYTDGTVFGEKTDYEGDLIFGGCALPKADAFANGYTLTVLNNVAQYNFQEVKSKDTQCTFTGWASEHDSKMDTPYIINSITGTGLASGATAETANFVGESDTIAKPSWMATKKATISVDGDEQSFTIAPNQSVYAYTLPETAVIPGANEIFLCYYNVNAPSETYYPGDVISLKDGDNLVLKSKFASALDKKNLFDAPEEANGNPYGTAAEKGLEFDAGTVIGYGSDSPTLESPTTSHVEQNGEQTCVGINGTFSGNFSMKYQLKNNYPHLNGNRDEVNLWEHNVDGTNDYTQHFNQWILKIGWRYNVVMTTRIQSEVPGHEKEFIDINLLMVSGGTDTYYDLMGVYVVVYNDGENQYVRTIEANSYGTVEEPKYATTWQSSGYHGGFIGDRFKHYSCDADNYAMISVDKDGNYKSHSAIMSPSTLSLEWDGDILKVVGQADVKDKDTPKVTYAAFDGTASRTWESIKSSREGIASFFENEYQKDKFYRIQEESYGSITLTGGCGLPLVNEAFAKYNVKIMNTPQYDSTREGSLVSSDEYEVYKGNPNGENAAGQFCVRGATQVGEPVSYILMNICGLNLSGTEEKIAKPDWYNNTADVIIDGVTHKVDLGTEYRLPTYSGTLNEDQAFKGYLIDGVQYAANDVLTIEKGKTYVVESLIVTAKISLDGVNQTGLKFFEGYVLPEYTGEDTANFIGYLAGGKLYKGGAKLQFTTENYEWNVYPIVLKAEFASTVDIYLKNIADDTIVRFKAKLTGKNLDKLAESGIKFVTTITNEKKAGTITYNFDNTENLIEGESGEYYLSAGMYGLTGFVNDSLTVKFTFSYLLEGDEADTVGATIEKSATIAQIASAALKSELAKAESERDADAIEIYRALGGKEE